MALNLALTAKINTDRDVMTLTDATTNWGVSPNINFTAVQYAELLVGYEGALYGPVIVTNIFTAATEQSDLVFVLTPSVVGIEGDTFNDGIYEFHYGVSDEATPPSVIRNVWPGESSYNIPTGSTTNKIPFRVDGDSARQYVLQGTFNVPATDDGVNPRITLNVNYQDGTKDTQEMAIPQTGVNTVVTATIDVNLQKEVDYIDGFLFNEDRNPSTGREGTITTISLNKQDLDLTSTVERALVSEETKQRINREAIDFRRSFLCGRRAFDEHEQFIIENTAFESVTIGATRGLVDEAEEIIDILKTS